MFESKEFERVFTVVTLVILLAGTLAVVLSGILLIFGVIRSFFDLFCLFIPVSFSFVALVIINRKEIKQKFPSMPEVVKYVLDMF